MSPINFTPVFQTRTSKSRQPAPQVKFRADSPEPNAYSWDDWDELHVHMTKNETMQEKIKKRIQNSQYPLIDEDEFRTAAQSKVDRGTANELARMHRQNRIDQIEIDLRTETRKPIETIVQKLKDINSRLVKMASQLGAY